MDKVRDFKFGVRIDHEPKMQK